MKKRWGLVTAAAVQLGLGLLGLRVALRERVPSDVRLFRLPADHLARWQWITGTGLSAPGLMLVLQAVFSLTSALRPSRTAARGLGVLGAIMGVLGYPAEVGFTRAVVSPDRVRTPLLLGGFVLALLIMVLGFRSAAPDRGRQSVSAMVSASPPAPSGSRREPSRSSVRAAGPRRQG